MSDTSSRTTDENGGNRPVALVTGAGSGIGREVAVQLAAEGYRVALVGRTRETLEQTAEACEGDTLVLVSDLSLAEENRRMVVDTIEAFGRLDVLVNNAGSSPLKGVCDATNDDIQKIMSLNAIAPIVASAEACKHMAAHGGGRVVMVSSYATVDPFPGLGVYAAAKAGVNLLAKAIRNELHAEGVRAFAVAPGAVETGLLRSLFDESMIPGSACLRPADVAAVIVACATGGRDSESGSTILLPSPSN